MIESSVEIFPPVSSSKTRLLKSWSIMYVAVTVRCCGSVIEISPSCWAISTTPSFARTYPIADAVPLYVPEDAGTPSSNNNSSPALAEPSVLSRRIILSIERCLGRVSQLIP